MKKLKILLLLFCLPYLLAAQSLSFSIKDQALQELNNIESQNQQLQQLLSNYETNYLNLTSDYQALMLSYNNIVPLMQKQEQSLQVKNQALINSENSLRACQSREYVYWIVLGGIVIYAILK